MTTSPTPVGHVIPKGATEIPDDVLGIEDRDGASATRVRDGWLPALCAEPGMRCQGHDDAEMLAFGPLTVSAVREPEPAAELPRHVAAILDDLKTAAPLVLSLPSVPEGTEALIGREGHRFEPVGDGAWRGPAGIRWSLGGLLENHAPLTPVMREPRTWPKLDAPGDLKSFTGESGRVYIHVTNGRRTGMPFFRPVGDEEAIAKPLWHWQVLDGPLTEVFNEPGGAS